MPRYVRLTLLHRFLVWSYRQIIYIIHNSGLALCHAVSGRCSLNASAAAHKPTTRAPSLSYAVSSGGSSFAAAPRAVWLSAGLSSMRRHRSEARRWVPQARYRRSFQRTATATAGEGACGRQSSTFRCQRLPLLPRHPRRQTLRSRTVVVDLHLLQHVEFTPSTRVRAGSRLYTRQSRRLLF